MKEKRVPMKSVKAWCIVDSRGRLADYRIFSTKAQAGYWDYPGYGETVRRVKITEVRPAGKRTAKTRKKVKR